MAAKVTAVDPFRIFLVGSLKDFLFPVQITSQSRMEEKIKQAIECILPQILEKMCTNTSARINQFSTVNGRCVEQDNI